VADTWSCCDWGACSANGKQGRTCGILVNCEGVETPSPGNMRDCTPEYPFLRVSKSPTVTTTTHEPSDTDVPVLALTIKAEETAAVINGLTFTALVDANDDGTYHVGTEGGATAANMLRSCDLLLGVSPISTYVDPEPEGLLYFDLTSSPVELAVDETALLTVRCDIAQQAAEGYVGLVLTEEVAGAPSVTAESGVIAGLTVTSDHIDGLPINGNGTSTASTIVSIVGGNPYPIIMQVDSDQALQSGTATLMRFTVSAVNEPISFKQVTFMIEHDLAGSATLTTTTGSSMRTISGTSLPGMAAFVRSGPASTGPSCDATGDWYCVLVATLANEITVTPGVAQTFELRLSISGGFEDGDQFRTSIIGDADLESGQLTEPEPGYGYGIGEVEDSFLWSDLSAASHNDDVGGSSDWFNGYDAFGLPTDSQFLNA
jgi:hypothetical protein